MRAGIAETDSAGTSRSKLTASIAQFVPLEDERAWIEPRLAFLLGLAERPAGGREELFAAWRTFFERISDHGTVAMVFEDLQWADSGLLDFIESLLEWSRAKPIYVVALTRPEITDVRPTWGVGQRSFLALHLEPLSDPTMGELVRGLVPDADSTAVDRIVARAEGMPLYAVEMIRMLADSGVLRAAEGAYELVGDLGDIQVPETLHALIASRLDALGAEDRALIQDAAILGKSFTLDGLVAVTGGERAHLEARLHELARKEFVVYEADPRSPERGQYAFVQSIIREVAYGMLSKADRRDRHLAAAHLFEAEHDDELAGVVAAHYVEALHATPEGSQADELSSRARDWLARAAARATALGSPVQALGYVAQALDLTPDGPARADLLVHAADAAADSIRPVERIAYLKEAIHVLHVHGDRMAEVIALGRLALALADEADVDELRPLAVRMRDRLGDGEDPLARALADHAEASVHYYDGSSKGACCSWTERRGAMSEPAPGTCSGGRSPRRSTSWPPSGGAGSHACSCRASSPSRRRRTTYATSWIRSSPWACTARSGRSPSVWPCRLPPSRARAGTAAGRSAPWPMAWRQRSRPVRGRRPTGSRRTWPRVRTCPSPGVTTSRSAPQSWPPTGETTTWRARRSQT